MVPGGHMGGHVEQSLKRPAEDRPVQTPGRGRLRADSGYSQHRVCLDTKCRIAR